MNETSAKLNFLRMAPRKVRAIADIIRGMSVNEAEAQLIFQRRRASKALLKLLRSAMANAKNNNLNPDKMIIGKITVDGGPMLKRALPRARGSASPIQKKTSHVTLVLKEVENPKEKRFNIVAAKKVKKAENVPPKKKKAESKEDGHSHANTKKTDKNDPGFFKKVFRRKAI